MPFCSFDDLHLHWCEDGNPGGLPVVFAHALATDLHLWDAVIPLLPQTLRLIRYDARGHGASACPPGPYRMGALVRDAERLLDALGVKDCVFVGLAMGGLVAQGLAVKRLDQLRALVLSNTAVKLGAPEVWERRIAAVQIGGAVALSDDIAARWFGKLNDDTNIIPNFLNNLKNLSIHGYAGTAAAIAGADFITPTSGLRLPTLVIAGSEDRETPPDLVRDLHHLIPASRFALMRGAGHLPLLDHPAEYAALLTSFLESIGHV